MSPPQHMQALALANEIRRVRGELRREVRALDSDPGRALLADMLDDGYANHDNVRHALAGVRVVIALTWVLRMQTRIACRYVTALGVTADAAEFRKLSDLTGRQRGLLADMLRGGLPRLAEVEEENAFELWRRKHNRQDAA